MYRWKSTTIENVQIEFIHLQRNAQLRINIHKYIGIHRWKFRSISMDKSTGENSHLMRIYWWQKFQCVNRATAEKATVVWRALLEAMLTLTHLRANRALLDLPRSDQEGDSVVRVLCNIVVKPWKTQCFLKINGQSERASEGIHISRDTMCLIGLTGFHPRWIRILKSKKQALSIFNWVLETMDNYRSGV